jgi:acyl-CoA carboxylase subunit beta
VTRVNARTLIAATADPGSFTAWDEPPVLDGYDTGYLGELKRARAKSGTDEAVLTGRALVHGQPAAVTVSEYGGHGLRWPGRVGRPGRLRKRRLSGLGMAGRRGG